MGKEKNSKSLKHTCWFFYYNAFKILKRAISYAVFPNTFRMSIYRLSILKVYNITIMGNSNRCCSVWPRWAPRVGRARCRARAGGGAPARPPRCSRRPPRPCSAPRGPSPRRLSTIKAIGYFTFFCK